MIKANELRIGNWVKVYTDQTVGIEVQQVYKIEEEFINDGEINSEVEPIPLTPEILEKCGFEKEGKDYTITTNNIKFLGFFYENYFVTLFNSARFVDLEYLHQLQNLYFALTGEELEIKLNVATQL